MQRGVVTYHLLCTLGRLPKGFHRACGKVFSFIAKDILHYRSDVVMTNIARSFPELKYKEIKNIYNGFYDHFGQLVAEVFYLAGSSRTRLQKDRMVEVMDSEVMQKAYDNSPSVMMLDSHLGNWETLMAFPVSNFTGNDNRIAPDNIAIPHKQLKSKVWEYVTTRIRTRFLQDGMNCEGYLETSNVLRYAVSHRGDKKVYVFITDQFPFKGAARMDVGEFMHQQTFSVGAAASLACKTGMSVVYKSCVRTAPWHHEAHFTLICEDARTMTAEQIMKEYYRLLEADIKKHPQMYLWSHKRWK